MTNKYKNISRTKVYGTFEVSCLSALELEFDGIGDAIECAVVKFMDEHRDLYAGKNEPAFYECLLRAKWSEVANVSEGLIIVSD